MTESRTEYINEIIEGFTELSIRPSVHNVLQKRDNGQWELTLTRTTFANFGPFAGTVTFAPGTYQGAKISGLAGSVIRMDRVTMTDVIIDTEGLIFWEGDSCKRADIKGLDVELYLNTSFERLRVHTRHGCINMTEPSLEVNIYTVSGNVGIIADVAFVTVNTLSGNVRLRGQGRARLMSGTGTVEYDGYKVA